MKGGLCRTLRGFGEFLQSPFLLLVRIYWGYQFFLAGAGKYENIEGTREFFSALQIPFPYFFSYCVAGIEYAGGCLLIVGLFSRSAAFFLSVVMLAAYWTTGYSSLVALFLRGDAGPFFNEAPFLYLYATVLVLLFGPGKCSLDYLFGREGVCRG